jgi:hypothetical protein
MAEINLTPLRQRVLRIVHQQPGLTAQDLGYELNDLGNSGSGWNHPSQATRFGAKQVTALIKAELVTAKRSRVRDGILSPRHAVEECKAGWAFLYLTAKGQNAVAGQMSDHQGEQ